MDLDDVLSHEWASHNRINLAVQINNAAPLRSTKEMYLNMTINQADYRGVDTTKYSSNHSSLHHNVCESTNFFA